MVAIVVITVIIIIIIIIIIITIIIFIITITLIIIIFIFIVILMNQILKKKINPSNSPMSWPSFQAGNWWALNPSSKNFCRNISKSIGRHYNWCCWYLFRRTYRTTSQMWRRNQHLILKSPCYHRMIYSLHCQQKPVILCVCLWIFRSVPSKRWDQIFSLLASFHRRCRTGVSRSASYSLLEG